MSENMKIEIPDSKMVHGLEITYKGKVYYICNPSSAEFVEVITGAFALLKQAERKK